MYGLCQSNSTPHWHQDLQTRIQDLKSLLVETSLRMASRISCGKAEGDSLSRLREGRLALRVVAVALDKERSRVAGA